MTGLAIVIVSFNAREALERCLASLHDSPPRVSHEIVVVDNASSDASVDAVTTRWPAVRTISLYENVGFARATNMGLRETTSELALLLNGDTIVPAGAIDRLVHLLGAHPEAAVVGPRLVDEHGAVELSVGRMIGPFNELWQKVIGRLHRSGFPPMTRYVERLTSRERAVDWVSGACLLVRRADAEAIGLLDERFFMYAEDVDFCAAIRQRGRTVLFTPGTTVVHLRGRSVASAPAATHAAYRRSQLAFYEKHHPRWAPVLRAYLRLRGELPPDVSRD
jgi:N-acetylglucosaminyl-diphospho-decaprenol L-rhamnosyltransferase